MIKHLGREKKTVVGKKVRTSGLQFVLRMLNVCVWRSGMLGLGSEFTCRVHMLERRCKRRRV